MEEHILELEVIRAARQQYLRQMEELAAARRQEDHRHGAPTARNVRRRTR